MAAVPAEVGSPRDRLTDRIGPGRLVVDRLSQLKSHKGRPPDLVLRWGAMPRSATVDFVVHLHGHSDCGQCMDLVREMEPRSGLDLADPANPATAGRTTPTLLILPRGNFYGGRSGHGYDFPALVLSTWVGRLELWRLRWRSGLRFPLPVVTARARCTPLPAGSACTHRVPAGCGPSGRGRLGRSGPPRPGTDRPAGNGKATRGRPSR